MNSLARTVDPARVAVAASAVRAHLRLDDDAEETHLASLIATAVNWAEGFTRRALITQTWAYYLDGFPTVIALPRPPLQSVSSIAYVDGAGDSQTLSTSVYTVDTTAEPGLIYPAYGEVWPPTQAIPKSVTVTFVAGYGTDPADVPAEIAQAISLYVSRHFDLREPVIVGTISSDLRSDEALLRPYQISGF